MIRLFHHYVSVRTLVLIGIEAAVIFQILILGFEIRVVEYGGPLPALDSLVFSLIMLLTMSGLGLYQSHTERFGTTVMRIVAAWALAVIAMALIYPLLPGARMGRLIFLPMTLAVPAALTFIRLLMFRATDLGLPRRRILVVGNGADAETLIRFLHEDSRARSIEYAGNHPVIGERGAGSSDVKIDHQQLRQTVENLRVSEIVIAARERRGGVLPLRQLLDCKLAGVRVVDLASFYERETGVLKIDNLRASWLIFGHGFDKGITRDVIKRIFDVVASLLLLVLTLPILAVAIIATVAESGRPVFYRQERVGQGGRPFTILKLRSMRLDAEKDGTPRWAGANDDRVTRVGRIIRKTRIDELPQLINVLRGDMSFVGPRPERPYFVRQLVDEIPYYDVRHSVKPGVTGWSQVRCQYGASVEDAFEKLQYDLYYVKNHSLFLDLLILVETVQVVLLGKGAR